jgi:hypothetical protein
LLKGCTLFFLGSGFATSSGSFDSSDTFVSDSPTFAVPTLAVDVGGAASSVSSEAILAPVKSDMETMNANLRNVVGNRHPMLMAAADQIFGAGGKKLRPAIVFLVARATAELMGLRWAPCKVASVHTGKVLLISSCKLIRCAFPCYLVMLGARVRCMCVWQVGKPLKSLCIFWML